MTTTYKYGADGLRTQKKVGSTTYNYYYADGLLIRQTWGSNYMDFLYDESGNAYSFVYNGTQYYYVRNLQGDVVKILNTSGTTVVAYSYDAWGKCTVTSGASNAIANANPIRYRGYYYDTDTGFYYLQSRYYDPTIKRFISADTYINANGDLLGFNMYAYCGNNPVIFADYTGQSFVLIAGLAISAKQLIGIGVLFIGSLVAATSLCEATNMMLQESSEATDDVDKKIEIINKKHSGEYVVYALADSNGDIQYIGRTKNLKRRLAAHSHSAKTCDLTLAWYTPPLTYCEARGLEQIGITTYNTLNLYRDTNCFGRNWINGINYTNSNKDAYIKAVDNYIYNKLANAYYNATGN